MSALALDLILCPPTSTLSATRPRLSFMPDSTATASSTLNIAAVAYLAPATQRPLHLASFPPSPLADLTHAHIAFAALDAVDDAVSNGLGSSPGKEGYLGLLLVIEHLAVYAGPARWHFSYRQTDSPLKCPG